MDVNAVSAAIPHLHQYGFDLKYTCNRSEFKLASKVTCNKLCGSPPQYDPAPCKLTFDLLIWKVVSESRVTWATSVPILVFLGLSVLDLGPMCLTDRRQTCIIA